MTALSQTTIGSLFDLSRRAKICVTGSDRLRFLNGQITNDVRKATESVAIEACILSAKGKMNAHVFISSAPNSFFVDAAPELRETLPSRLERYVIADDVQIDNVAEQFSIFHVLAPSSSEIGSDCRVVSARRFMESGWDVWVDSARHRSVFEELSSRFRFLDDAMAETFRIEQGIPRWGCELTEEIIPIEANLENRTVDYEKGCYIGQEVISRIKMSGQTNKRLAGLTSLNGSPLSNGMKLAQGDKEAGWVTSAAHSGGRELALGYVKRGFNDLGIKLDAFAGEKSDAVCIPVEIIALPFR